ncbi:5' nucleotidase, NT5C type [Thalassoglobus sp.]|uniref:5' nucleotidase, NT5C type n=1 Tax=Thalassoglobus sp. TaxID=2795869 RepID=UPI003AA875B8
MNVKPIIYLDMDGVLFDFVAAFGKVLNIPDIKDQLAPGVRNIAPQIGMTEDEMWERIGHHGYAFWNEMPEYPWSRELVDLVERNSSEWYILSSPARNSDSLKGKLEALKLMFGERFRRYILTPNKRLLAGRNRILIDDHERHCEEFENDGGKAILFPRQWNRYYSNADEPLQHTKEILARIIDGNLVE